MEKDFSELDTQFYAAAECASHNNFVEAVDYIKNCMKIEQKDPFFNGFYAQVLCDIGRYDLALFEIKIFLNKYPNDIDGLLVLGSVYMELEEWESAERVYRKILTIDICNGLAYNNFGCIYMKTGRYEEAKNIIGTGLRIDPESNLLKKNYQESLNLLNGGDTHE